MGLIDNTKNNIVINSKTRTDSFLEYREGVFKDFGVDKRIDERRQNKRTFEYLAFENIYAGISLLKEMEKPSQDTLRTIERSIKENRKKGNITEGNLIFDNIFGKIISNFCYNPLEQNPSSQESIIKKLNTNFSDMYNLSDFLIATHGFVYLSQKADALFTASNLSGISESTRKTIAMPEQITEIREHIKEIERKRVRSNNITKIDITFCTDKINEIAKELHLSSKEKSIYLANIIATDKATKIIQNSKYFNMIFKNKDYDKEYFDFTLAYRVENELKRIIIYNTVENFLKKSFFVTDDISKDKSAKEKIESQKAVLENLLDNDLPVTARIFSDFLDKKASKGLPINNKIIPKKFLNFQNNMIRAKYMENNIKNTEHSAVLTNIITSFKDAENLYGPIGAKNRLPEILSYCFSNAPFPEEQFEVIDLIAKPYYLSKNDCLNIAAAFANLYPAIPDLICFEADAALGNAISVEKWISDYADLRLKYGASVIEVAGMKRKIKKEIEDS